MTDSEFWALKKAEIDALYESAGLALARSIWGSGNLTLDPAEAERRWKARPWRERARLTTASAVRRWRNRLALWVAPWLDDSDD